MHPSLLTARIAAVVCFLLSAAAPVFSQQPLSLPFEREATYGTPSDTTLPDWVRAMYAPDPVAPEVIALYEAYYQTVPFEKNQHTQYYKRWLKAVGPYLNESGKIRPPDLAAFDRQWAQLDTIRTQQALEKTQRGGSPWGVANWTGIGPFDFDKDAAGRSHAPGAAHVYTIEKAPSNPDILYCGTANAGVWKTVNRGLNWTCLTQQLPINYCNALEIHPSDPNIVLMGANGRVYKSTNGGASWAQIGDAAFNSVSHDVREIAFQPGNTEVLFVGSNRGFFRSANGGESFTKVIYTKTDGYFSELEFKPNDPNTLYVVQSEVFDKYTELYTSNNGGLSWSLLNNWPPLASATSVTNQYIHRPASTAGANRATFSNDQLGAAIPDFTLEMRVRLPANTIYDKAFLSNKNWSSGMNKGWVLGARYTGELTFNMGTGSTRVDLHTSGIWDDSWHLITLVYRAVGAKELYKDGVLVSTTNTNLSGDVSTTLPMVLGYDGNLNYGGQDMNVDEIRIFNTALSAAVIQTWNTQEATNAHPQYANLLHHYKCNEPSGNTLTDATGTNHGTIIGTMNRLQDQMHYSTTHLGSTEHQKRAEIATTAAQPDRIYALLSGKYNNGEGLYGVYISNNGGNNWTHTCCGSGPGGAAVGTPTPGLTTPGTNANLLGYSEHGSDEGGQYYYDLALDADPGNANKVHIAGINHWYSTDGGTTFQLTAKWSWPGDPEYIHADIHDIAIYNNEVWVVCDGGIFMSADSGKVNFSQRQFGIEGTDFWGFGMGHKDGDVMLGGTYHNSHLLKNNNVYINGWTSYTGSADGTRGFVNPGKPKTVYNDSGKDALPSIRTQGPIRTTFSKLPNIGGTPSKITWDPRCYNCLYTGNGADLWYSEDDGDNFTLVRNFGSMNVADIEVLWSDPNTLYVCTVGGFYDPKAIWKTTDRGQTWTNITPSPAALGFPSDMSFDIAVGDNNLDVWLACFHPYGWNSGNNNKIFYSSDGGVNWTNWSTSVTNGQSITNILYQRGANGVYLGTRNTVLYRNKSMSDWVLYDQGLPLNTHSQAVLPWYKEGKIRNAGNRSVWESPMYELGQPQAQPMADKRAAYCKRDTVYFADYSAHYKTGATWSWTFSPAPAYISSSTVENPKVVFGTSGNYSISLTVTDSMGSSTKTLTDGITVTSMCDPDTIPGQALQITANGQYAAAGAATNLNTNVVTMMAWVKPTVTHTGVTGVLFFRGGTTVAGIHLENDNRLAYHWNDQFYSFNSNLFLPANQWSHIAMVTEPTKTTLYLNGRPAINNATHVTEAFDAVFNIGRDPTSSSRTFKGLIDEVCLFNRALTQSEIREQMHFVKKPQNDPSIISYYQFNEPGGQEVLDRAGLYHARLTSANRNTSTCPIGTGVSTRVNATTGGLLVLGNTGLEMTFPPSGAYPNGELSVARLYRQPDALPGANSNCPHYWIVNNYGSNANFSALSNITFKNIGSTVANDKIFLHKRSTGADGAASWGAEIAQITTANSSANATVTFPGSGITNFSQFNVSAQASALPLEWLHWEVRTQNAPNKVLLHWKTAAERNTAWFEVERKQAAASEVEVLTRIPAKGGIEVNTYEAADNQPYEEGWSYYRLKQMDTDGQFTYSDWRAVLFQALHTRFSLSPNPVLNGQNAWIQSETEGFKAILSDPNGRLLWEQTLQEGTNSIPTEHLPAGLYFIKITNGATACLKKLIVE